jgi:hypothetical protein
MPAGKFLGFCKSCQYLIIAPGLPACLAEKTSDAS